MQFNGLPHITHVALPTRSSTSSPDMRMACAHFALYTADALVIRSLGGNSRKFDFNAHQLIPKYTHSLQREKWLTHHNQSHHMYNSHQHSKCVAVQQLMPNVDGLEWICLLHIEHFIYCNQTSSAPSILLANIPIDAPPVLRFCPNPNPNPHAVFTHSYTFHHWLCN